MEQDQLSVYRFVYTTAGQEISPRHMWGTRDAIATLRECAPIQETERHVDSTLVDRHGFYFEPMPAAAVAFDEGHLRR